MQELSASCNKPHILLTGSTGFIGKALCQRLVQQGYRLTLLSRKPRELGTNDKEPNVKHVTWRLEQAAESAWFNDVDIVIHLAAAASGEKSSLHELTAINVAGTANLFKQASLAGCKRFVFLSSAQVNWSQKAPYDKDKYTQSKLLAERKLQQLSATSPTELVVIRPALVYGPGVKGNFNKLLNGVKRGQWLPLGALKHNKRSLLSLSNLLDFIQLSLSHPLAGQQSWNLADKEAVSSVALVRALASASKQKAKLVHIPVWCLRVIGVLTGRSAQVQRLAGSAVIDVAEVEQKLGWQPKVNLQQELKLMLRYNTVNNVNAENQNS